MTHLKASVSLDKQVGTEKNQRACWEDGAGAKYTFILFNTNLKDFTT